MLELAGQRQMACHRVEVLDFGAGKGADPIRQLVRSLMGISLTADDDSRRQTLADALAEDRIAHHQEPFLCDLLALPLPDELRAIYDAMENEHRNHQKRETVVSLLHAAAERSPQLILVDDVHWADRLTLAYLAALAAATGESRVVLALTTRVAGDPLDSAWRHSAKGASFTTIDLAALRPADALAMAQTFLEVTAQTAHQCVERAEGNPLFLEQLLLNAEESAESAVPGSVQSLVLARVDNLPPQDKAALQAVSVLGQRFDAESARQLIGNPGYEFLTLTDHALLRRDEAGYIFAHALVRDGVYESLLHSTRRELHGRAAEWYRERDLSIRAEHLERAEDPAAAQAYLDAARAEATALHFERAVELVKRGSALEADTKTACGLLLEKGRLQRELGVLIDSISSYERAVSLAPDDLTRCLGWLGMAEAMRLTDDYERGLEVLNRAEPVAMALNRPDLESQVQFLRGCIYWATGLGAESLEAYEQAVTSAKASGLFEELARALGGLGDGYYALGRLRDNYDALCNCIELATQHGLHRIEAANRVAKAYTEWYLVGTREALDEMNSALAQAEQFGLWRSVNLAKAMVAGFLIQLCQLDEAEEILLEVYRELTIAGAPRLLGILAISLSMIEVRRGRMEKANQHAKRALQFFKGSGSAQSTAMVYGLLALTSLDYASAVPALAEGRKELAKGCPVNNHYEFWRFSIETALRFEQWEDALKFADEFEQFNKAEHLTWADFFVRRGRALAAVGQGRVDEGLAAEIADVIELGDRMGLLVALPELRSAAEHLKWKEVKRETV